MEEQLRTVQAAEQFYNNRKPVSSRSLNINKMYSKAPFKPDPLNLLNSKFFYFHVFN